MKNNMKIALDIDDTITDTYEFLLDRMSEFYNIDKKYLLDNNYSYINMNDELKQEEKKFITEMFESRLNDIPIKKNAKECINELYDRGNDIYIITARKDFANTYSSTSQQLKKYGIKYTKLICTTDKKSACIKNAIDIYIDDSVRNTNLVKDIVKYVFLFECEHNKLKNTEVKRVKNWKELSSILKEI